MNHIGTNVRAAREKLSWTQAQLAGAAGVTERTVQRVEAGEPASAETLQAVAGALDVSVDDLRSDPSAAAEDAAKVAAWVKSMEEKYKFIALTRVATSADWNGLSTSDAFQLDCKMKDDRVQDAAAEFQQELRDWLDILSDIDPIDRRNAMKTLFGRVQEFEQDYAVAVCVGKDDVRLKTGTPGMPMAWSVFYVVLTPLSEPLPAFALRERGGVVRFQ